MIDAYSCPYEIVENSAQSETRGNLTFTRHSTDELGIFVLEFKDKSNPDGSIVVESFKDYLHGYEKLKDNMMAMGLGNYIPEVVDLSIEHQWVALSVASGMYTIQEVAKSYPDGLDGRDWAWMLRRLLLTVEQANRIPLLSESGLLIHPEGHGTVILDWPNFEVPQNSFVNSLYEISKKHLRAGKSEEKIVDFLERNRNKDISLKILLQSYKGLLKAIYGPPMFRPFTVDEELSEPVS